MTDGVEIINGCVTPTQIIRAIVSNAEKICETYGFDLVVDDTYIPTETEMSVKLTVKCIGGQEE